jgi:nucleoside-diphosphate-sugar epimerase
LSLVVVTGASGRVGPFVIDDLLAHGFAVRATDKVAPRRCPVPFVKTDLTHVDQAREAVRGADCVVHLAAIAAPHGLPAQVVFANNVLATFSVVEAAAELGVRRLVLLSTDSVLGFPWATRRICPEYLPIDEAHPLRPQDPYGLSKLASELTVQAACRRSDLTAVALRSTLVVLPGRYRALREKRRRDRGSGADNLWSYVDARDLATACRLALDAPIASCEACYVAARDTSSAIPSRDLFRCYYPEVTRFAPDWSDCRSALTCARAESLLGFRPRYDWRSEAR